MKVMMASAPKVPAKTMPRGSFSASSTAMKNVLSPSSEKRMSRKPDSAPSLKGLSPSTPAAPCLRIVSDCMSHSEFPGGGTQTPVKRSSSRKSHSLQARQVRLRELERMDSQA